MKDNNIRVLMCCSDLETYKGGMVSVVKNYLSWQSWREVEIQFVATHIEGSKLDKSLCFAKAYRKIEALLRSGQIDLAHLHMAEYGSFYRKAWIAALCRKYNVPVLIHHHGARFEAFYDSLSPKMKAYVGKVLTEADANLVLSDYWKQSMAQKAPNAKLHVLYNAVPVPQANPYSTDRRNLLFLGRLGERKGIYDLLNALKQIERELPPDVRYYLCGDGEVDKVKQRVRELGLEHRIGRIGWIDGKQKEEILKTTAVHVLPSWHEGLPMSILETMANGIPNISTDIAAIPEVLKDGENGFLIHPGEVDKLAQRILELMSSDALRETFSGRSYREIGSRFSLADHLLRLEGIYEQLTRSEAGHG